MLRRPFLLMQFSAMLFGTFCKTWTAAVGHGQRLVRCMMHGLTLTDGLLASRRLPGADFFG